MFKETINKLQENGLKYYDSFKDAEPYLVPVLNSDSGFNISIYAVEDEERYKLNGFLKETEFNSVMGEKKDCPKNPVPSVEGDIMDLGGVLKPKKLENSGSKLEDPISYVNLPNHFETSTVEQKSLELVEFSQVENDNLDISPEKYSIQKQNTDNSDQNSNVSSVQDSKSSAFYDASSDKSLDNDNSIFANDNLHLLAHCSLIYGRLINRENKSSKDCSLADNNIVSSESRPKAERDTVIKCSLRWDKILNIKSDEIRSQPDIFVDLDTSKVVDKRLPSDYHSSNHCKIVEADNKLQTSSIDNVKRLALKRKIQPEERIPKMIIKKIEGEYQSYFKME